MDSRNITFQDRLDELILDIRNPNSKSKIFILVEGETDLKLFRKLFHGNNCKIEWIPGGNPKVEESVKALIEIYPLVIGIRDADFIHLEGIAYDNANVFLTDYHDIEMMMISEQEVFGALAFEYTEYPKDRHSELKNKILNSIERIGYLKWLNEKADLKLKFDPGFNDLLSFTNFDLDIKQYISRVLNKSPNATIQDVDTIKIKMEDLKKSNPDTDMFQLCNGHDFLKAISEYINRQRKSSGVNHSHMGSICRTNYDNKIFEKTYLYRNTKKWADDNNCVIY